MPDNIRPSRARDLMELILWAAILGVIGGALLAAYLGGTPR